jgi:predicted DNA repair protein MutK
MSAGLFGLFDDVAAIARAAAASIDDVAAAAAKTSVKAAGVVIDDTAVTPQYLEGISPERELPIVRRIAIGSLRNKLLLILPVLLILSEFAHFALAPILFLGGGYLAFEGAEKVLEWIRGPHVQEHEEGGRGEEALVRGAIRTDLVLSAEIMMISSASLDAETFWGRAVVLTVVAVLITIAVYGLVALIVKMDDVGLHLLGRPQQISRTVGRGLVAGMPLLLSFLSIVGVLAMLWVGGHILIAQLAEMGWHWPEHTLVTWGHHVGGVAGWAVETICAGVIGLAVGLALAFGMELVLRRLRSAEGASRNP